MDVNRAEGIAPAMNNDSGGSSKDQHARDHEQETPEAPHEPASAFEIDGLAAEITPRVQMALDSLAAEIEPLRAQLALSKDREQMLREDLSRHAFLPVPGRREFVRELNHVLNHLTDLTDAPHLALLHVENADDVRRRYGRDALDRFLSHIAATIAQVLPSTDVLGNLGGNDFALIMFGDQAEAARHRADEIARHLEQFPLVLAGGQAAPKLVAGIAQMSRGTSAEALIQTADRDLLAHRT